MFRAPRGTQDLLPEEAPYWRRVEEVIHQVCRRYGYRLIATPTFEETSLFVRGVGQGTDIVEKEMYSFEDKGGESLTLRPEATAPVVRAYLEHGMHALPQPVKLYSIISIFRYERPQAGRLREAHQLNVEALGEMDPALDAEVLCLALDLYRELGLSGLSLQLNSTGCPRCRPAYIQELKRYYLGHLGQICSDCQLRYGKNPLRLLDCKVDRCQPILAGAPNIRSHLCPECAGHFVQLLKYLDLLGLPYTINPRLVRGLDYYTKTVCEVWAPGIGAQNAVGGGGRYDGLARELGGRPTPGIGIAMGIERIVMTMKSQSIAVRPEEPPRVFLAYLGQPAKEAALRLSATLRAAGLSAICSFGDRSLKAQLKQAGNSGAAYAVILGEEELKRGLVTLRDMARSQQVSVEIEGLPDRLRPTEAGNV
ncbi:MAG: histidine--tRNA ligase [Chloroflexota bacterium]